MGYLHLIKKYKRGLKAKYMSAATQLIKKAICMVRKGQFMMLKFELKMIINNMEPFLIQISMGNSGKQAGQYSKTKIG